MEAARGAAPSDLDAVVALARAARDEVAAQRGGDLWSRREARREPLDASYSALLDRADAHLVVGTLDGVAVGFGAVEVEVLGDGTRLGVVTDLWVDPGARGVGVGEAVLTELTAFCESAGCTGLDARALPGDRAAKNFFEGSGFTARALVMHRTLDRTLP